MTTLKIAAALALLGLPLAALSAPAMAATAHNSQAGANGSTSNDAAPTGRHMRATMKKKHMKRM